MYGPTVLDPHDGSGLYPFDALPDDEPRDEATPEDLLDEETLRNQPVLGTGEDPWANEQPSAAQSATPAPRPATRTDKVRAMLLREAEGQAEHLGVSLLDHLAECPGVYVNVNHPEDRVTPEGALESISTARLRSYVIDQRPAVIAALTHKGLASIAGPYASLGKRVTAGAAGILAGDI